MARKKKGLHFYQKEKKIKPSIIKEGIELLVATLVVVFLAYVLTSFIGMRTSVIGDSMEPALYNGQEILINRFVYMLSSPKRGDVVVFLPNGNENTHYYVKRVVGLPGETVQITDGILYINGEPLDTDEDYDIMIDAGLAANGITLENNQYFVLGDNRNSSEDSRSDNIGPVSSSDILGKAWFHLQSNENDVGIGFVD